MKSEALLSRRERQIMDVLHQRRRASAAEVLAALPDPPSYSSVRALLRILESKGHARHVRDGTRYIYLPRVSPATARRSALRRVVETFFAGSVARTMAALLTDADTRLADSDWTELQGIIEQARREGH